MPPEQAVSGLRGPVKAGTFPPGNACVTESMLVYGGGDSLILMLSGPFSLETETLQAEGG